VKICEIYGNIMEILWKYYGNIWKYYGNIWKVLAGSLWKVQKM